MQLTVAPNAADLEGWTPAGLPGVEVRGLYVHIPFCFHKCHYCDFYSITRQSPQRMERFVELVLGEARGWAGGARGPVVRPRTVFFGGGTPSLLPLADMRRLIEGLRATFDFSDVDEWTVECNPATVSADYCRMLRELGVNRLSFGAQSFDPSELKVLERHHDPEDVRRSVEIARSAGFERLNVDLIYAIPGQDLASWRRSLEMALSLGTEHLSCYGLTYEPNTAIAVRKRLGQLTAAEDEVELEMLHWTRRRLRDAGYRAYEISNYARLAGEAALSPTAESPHPGPLPEYREREKEAAGTAAATEGGGGAECRHNLLYWNGGSYVGLGPSAASHVQGWRWRNRPHLGEWERAVAGGGVPTADAEKLTPIQRAGELAMLQLRLEGGVRYGPFQAVTGVDARAVYADVVARLSALGLIESDQQGFRLTDTGINVADAVAAELVAAGGDV